MLVLSEAVLVIAIDFNACILTAQQGDSITSTITPVLIFVEERTSTIRWYLVLTVRANDPPNLAP